LDKKTKKALTKLAGRSAPLLRQLLEDKLHKVGEFLGVPFVSKSKCLDLARDPLHMPDCWEVERIKSVGREQGASFTLTLTLRAHWLPKEEVKETNVRVIECVVQQVKAQNRLGSADE
jgi:hypothetical protein